jgi:hypothetical protein
MFLVTRRSLVTLWNCIREYLHRNTSIPRGSLEVAAISLGAPLLGCAVAKDDPFLIHASFPWLVLGPLLMGVQHGLVPALSCSALCSRPKRALLARVEGGQLQKPGLEAVVTCWLNPRGKDLRP